MTRVGKPESRKGMKQPPANQQWHFWKILSHSASSVRYLHFAVCDISHSLRSRISQLSSARTTRHMGALRGAGGHLPHIVALIAVCPPCVPMHSTQGRQRPAPKRLLGRTPPSPRSDDVTDRSGGEGWPGMGCRSSSAPPATGAGGPPGTAPLAAAVRSPGGRIVGHLIVLR